MEMKARSENSKLRPQECVGLPDRLRTARTVLLSVLSRTMRRLLVCCCMCVLELGRFSFVVGLLMTIEFGCRLSVLCRRRRRRNEDGWGWATKVQ